MRLLFVCLLLWGGALFAAGEGTVRLVTVHDAVTPVTARYVVRNLREAAAAGDRLVLIEIDTPGGLDTAMREIVKGILASPVPVVTYVAPSGARAASAGAIIAISADVCAMAPGTNIGAAHPVSIGEKPGKTMEEKIVNDAEAYAEGIARQRGRNAELARKMVRESISLSADRALDEKLVDLVARDRGELLRLLDGRVIRHRGEELTLSLSGCRIVPAGMTTRERVLQVISDPNVAYVLMMIGMLGLFFEFANPGVILPGAIGGISLILALFAFQTLPVNYAGVLLIVLALVLFIAEVKIVSHGMLTVGGVIAMVLGSLFLFESSEPAFRVSWSVILTTVLATTAFFVFVVAKAVKAHRAKPTTGREGLVGERGEAESAIAPEGKVFIRGEYWDALSDEPIAAGEPVEVVAVEGMRLRVRRGTIHPSRRS